ncbi:MAG: hypothetical protein ACLQVY_14310 [Limisphaerales bacterium]
MRTPREILLHHHRTAIPKLNVLRREVVRQLNPRQPSHRAAWLLCFPGNFWCQMIWPARRVWTGLAATWLLILVANFSLRTGTPQKTASISSNSYGFVLSLREEEQLLGGFNEAPAPKMAAPPAHQPSLLRPRTERRGHVTFWCVALLYSSARSGIFVDEQPPTRNETRRGGICRAAAWNMPPLRAPKGLLVSSGRGFYNDVAPPALLTESDAPPNGVAIWT